MTVNPDGHKRTFADALDDMMHEYLNEPMQFGTSMHYPDCCRSLCTGCLPSISTFVDRAMCDDTIAFVNDDGVIVGALSWAQRSTQPPGLTVLKSSAFIPYSVEVAADYGLYDGPVPEARPAVRYTWRQRVRMRVNGIRYRWGVRVGSWLAGESLHADWECERD